MDDSDEDFENLCSKLLKRVRKKPGESRQKVEQHPSSQAGDGDKTRRNNKRDAKPARTQPVCSDAVCGRAGRDSGATGSRAAAAGQRAESGSSAQDKVLLRMQQFRRASPQRVVHKGQPTNHETECDPPPPAPLTQRPEAFSSGLHLDSDEAVAQRLQQQLDREAAEQTVDLEDGGLFFCQICHRDLSHMTPEGRTQHLNRCLDESEGSGPAPPPAVPDCPICGKKFKSQKSRCAHLKRCSSELGVAPAVLLQAVHRQTEEAQSVPTASANTLIQSGGAKRKGPSKVGLPARKKPRKKTEALDDDTMVALALSSSLLEQQRERDSERELQTGIAASHTSIELKCRSNTGKGPGKRKTAAVPRPPPLLLVQDAEEAMVRLQERVSALLLRGRAPSPPTPTRCPSRLPARSWDAPLWHKSRLLEKGCPSDFYAPELREFITPWEWATTDVASSNTTNEPPSVQPASEGTPGAVSIRTAASSPAPSTPGTGPLLVGSQALRDLMELAEDGMTPTQCGYTASDKSVGQIPNLVLSGFVPEEPDEQADRCVSDFLPQTRHKTRQSMGADNEPGSHRVVSLSRLASDLSSMVNNPQLSDVQLQVDSGDVYFAHSFMVYARCPLLAQMVHESGLGVQEEGMPGAQRVLMSDVPGQAVLVLLQYLYTAHCSIPASLQPHVLELASRFDLRELLLLCELQLEDAAALADEEVYVNQEENVNNQTDQTFVELLRSMWNQEGEDEGTDTNGGGDREKGAEGDSQDGSLTSGERELGEEKVNEEELEEIYEFAATQRKREDEIDSVEDGEEKDGEEVFAKLTEPKRRSTGLGVKNLPPNSQHELDSSYNRLFSDSWGVYEEGDRSSLPSTSNAAKRHTVQSQHHQPLSPELSRRTLDCSPEVSWLIPSTPLQHQQSTRTFSTQTKSSMCRTRLFPRAEASSSSVFSSPALPLNNRLQTSNSPTGVSEGSLAKVKLEGSFSRGSSPDLNVCSKRSSSCHAGEDGEVFAVPPSQPKLSRPSSSISSKREEIGFQTALYLQPQPYSSTPMHTHLHQPPVLMATSLLHSNLDQQRSPSQEWDRAPSESPEKTELGGFHLSPLSDPSDPHSYSSRGCVKNSQRHSDSSRQSRPSVESSSHNSTGAKAMKKGIRNKQEERETECGNKDMCDEREQVEAMGEVAEFSFQQSFTAMDEPPIAFNDSWGLDACAGAAPGCFSLRLEDSRGSSQRERSSPGQPQTARSSSSSTSHQQSPSSPCVLSSKSRGAETNSSPSKAPSTKPSTPEITNSLLDPKLWDSWEEEEEEEEALPLSKRVNPSAQLNTPINRRRRTLVPITPMAHYSEMDTPELKNKLNNYGVRPLPKRQMVFKLKEIHQYTHQLASSDSEVEAPSAGLSATGAVAAGNRPASCAQTVRFKEPRAPAAISPLKANAELLSASQGSNTSSNAASEESESRSNPELCLSSDGDSDSDGGVSASQVATRLQDGLQAVRSFILSDSELYSQILQYQPLVLSQLQHRLKAAGIRLGAAKLVDYLDSQCITFTTAKPSHSAPSRRRVKKTSRGAKAASRKRGVTAPCSKL